MECKERMAEVLLELQCLAQDFFSRSIIFVFKKQSQAREIAAGHQKAQLNNIGRPASDHRIGGRLHPRF